MYSIYTLVWLEENELDNLKSDKGFTHIKQAQEMVKCFHRVTNSYQCLWEDIKHEIRKAKLDYYHKFIRSWNWNMFYSRFGSKYNFRN